MAQTQEQKDRLNKLFSYKDDKGKIEYFGVTNITQQAKFNSTVSYVNKNTGCYFIIKEVAQKEKEETTMFTEEEVLKLKKIIEVFDVQQELPPEEEIKQRSINVYTESFNQFAEFCKRRNIRQADAIYFALKQYMQTH